MKRTLFFLMGILPFFLMAQPHVTFPENVTLKVEKTEVNTSSSDFGPSFVENELWFSAFTANEITKLSQGKTKGVFYDLFAVQVNNKGNISGGKNLRLQEFSAGYHAGPVSYCNATNELFVTLSNIENPEIKNVVFQKANIPLKIIILKKSGTTWTDEGELPFNSSTYSVGHPAISITGDTLIFASDIPGKGLGGTDLYMTIRQNGKWGEMVNLGENINTKGDDMFPFLHKGKQLFYASNGKTGGNGGLDIYYSSLTGNGFGAAKNLNELNSPEDDFGLVIHPLEETGYFVSQKAGGEGGDDIYKVLFEGEYELELLVRDKKNLEPISNVKVEFSDNTTLFTDNNGLVKRELQKGTDYSATSVHEGFMNESVTFSTKGEPYGTIKAIISIEKVEKGQKFVMENIYYEFDKWNILPESEVELDKLVKVLNDNPAWKVELGSHTDSRGTDAYNEKLSQKRSESAVSYIVSQGIPANRIIAKGYGESQLVNECADGVSCTDEQHQENRRTEFTILETN
ncbi:OmpA family protein [Mariniphaga sediminis]|uniref:OmpA family protein n=1 Tax=Mariniphaga sediminis TaxID=1628158 RepID=A0A399CWD1_9BACT|nr:OmpA family protein [Mariniphaga sediminis]RIH63533.1 OmpA family protein [Mariniphaga sediminis]